MLHKIQIQASPCRYVRWDGEAYYVHLILITDVFKLLNAIQEVYDYPR